MLPPPKQITCHRPYESENMPITWKSKQLRKVGGLMERLEPGKGVGTDARKWNK